MFFARGDFLDDVNFQSFCVVDFFAILSTAFVVPTIPPGLRENSKGVAMHSPAWKQASNLPSPHAASGYTLVGM